MANFGIRMRRNNTSILLTFLTAVLFAPVAFAASLLEIQLPNGETKTFSRENLESLPQSEVVRKSGNNSETHYSGPTLGALLAQCGVAIGDKMKGDEIRFVLLASGADGYSVALSMAEVEPSISEGKIIVALKRDDTALSATEGPLRLALEKDQRPVRWVKNLVRIVVSNATQAK